MANKYRLKFSLSNGETIDAGEIIVPEGAKGDKGDKGDPYTLTSTDKAAIVQDVLAALPYYDGSVIISGGVELISFTIDATSYQAEEGMTWVEWVESSYNTNNYTTLLLDGVITVLIKSASNSRYGYGLSYNNTFVPITDVIVADRAYVQKYGSHTGGV